MRLNDIPLTEHFNLKEFECPCCHRVRICPLLLLRLEKVRVLWGEPMVLTSAFRCDAHNSAVGGVKNSLHRLGQAGAMTWVLAAACGWALLLWVGALLGMGGRIAEAVPVAQPALPRR